MCGCQLSWCGCLICPILFSNCDGVGGIRNISLLDINVAFRIVLDVGLMLVVCLFGCFLVYFVWLFGIGCWFFAFPTAAAASKISLCLTFCGVASPILLPLLADATTNNALSLTFYFPHPFSGNFMLVFLQKKTYSCCHCHCC